VVVRFVIVPVDELSTATVPEAEVRSAIFAVLIVVVANVEFPVTTKVLVVVLFVAVKLAIKPVTASKNDAKKLVDVALLEAMLFEKKLVEELFVVIRLSIVADATWRSEIVVVASDVVPVTPKFTAARFVVVALTVTKSVK
jgi:hypothetical protein